MNILLFGPIVLVPVRVNGSGVLWFELDTGFQNSVIDPKWIGPLGLKSGRKQRVDAPGGSVERATITGATLGFPGLQIKNQVFSAIDQSPFAPFFGHAVDGILGFDFLERFVTEIDYEAQRIRLYDPATYRYEGAGSSIPIDISLRQPYIEARVLRKEDAPAPGRFEIDTGSMDALNLNTPFAASNRIPGRARSLSVRGRSLGGETSGVLTRVDGLELGNIRIDDPIAGIVQDARARYEGASFDSEIEVDASAIDSQVLGVERLRNAELAGERRDDRRRDNGEQPDRPHAVTHGSTPR